MADKANHEFLDDISPNDNWALLSADALNDEHDREGYPEGWLDPENPEELPVLVHAKFPNEDLMRTVTHAVGVALEEIPSAYRSPFLRTAATRAAKLALGLDQFPDTVETSEDTEVQNG